MSRQRICTNRFKAGDLVMLSPKFRKPKELFCFKWTLTNNSEFWEYMRYPGKVLKLKQGIPFVLLSNPDIWDLERMHLWEYGINDVIITDSDERKKYYFFLEHLIKDAPSIRLGGRRFDMNCNNIVNLKIMIPGDRKMYYLPLPPEIFNHNLVKAVPKRISKNYGDKKRRTPKIK